MNRGLLIILKCFLTSFTHLISSANHWLTLWHGKEKEFLKISPLSSNFPDSNPPCLLGHNTFGGQSSIPRAPVSRVESASGKIQENFLKHSWYRAIPLRPAYTPLPTKSLYLLFLPGQPQSCGIRHLRSCCASMETKEFSHSATRIFCLCCNNCELWLKKIKNPVCILMNSLVSCS